MTCRKCLLSKPDTAFPLGEKICRQCKNKAAKERRAKKNQVEVEVNRQINMVFKQVKE